MAPGRFRISVWFRCFSTVRSGIHAGLDGLGSDSQFNQDSASGIKFQVRLEFSLRLRLSIGSNFQLGFSLPYPEKALPGEVHRAAGGRVFRSADFLFGIKIMTCLWF